MTVRKLPFYRDCFFYALSTGLLYWVLLDASVSLFESVILLVFCGLYASTVGLTSKFEQWYWPETCSSKNTSRVNSKNAAPQVALPGPAPATNSKTSSDNASDAPLKKGSIQVQLNRRNSVHRFGSVGGDSVIVEISRHQRYAKPFKSPCIVNSNSDGITLEPLESIGSTRSAIDEFLQDSKSLSSLTTPLILDKEATNRLIRFDDMYLAETTTQVPELVLQVEDKELGKVSISLAFETMASKEHLEEIISRKIALVRASDLSQKQPVEVVDVLKEIQHTSSYGMKFLLVLAIPIEVLLGYSMSWCDVKLPGRSDKYASCFCMSMFWLAVFSYLMCSIADIIHADFGISTSVLGITLCAIGTSFPNFYASILMAKEGRSAMAIANALGSNVQNVLLALAFPWFLRTLTGGPYPIAADGIQTGIIWMAGTLVIVVGFSLVGGCQFNRIQGYVLVALYAVYLFMGV